MVVLEMPELYDTRWASRFACIRVCRERFDVIAESLQEIGKPSYRDRTAAVEANVTYPECKQHGLHSISTCSIACLVLRSRYQI
jgi:hypothetical protein